MQRCIDARACTEQHECEQTDGAFRRRPHYTISHTTFIAYGRTFIAQTNTAACCARLITPWLCSPRTCAFMQVR